LQPGKLADLVVLTKDIFADPDVASARVAMTIVGGRIVYFEAFAGLDFAARFGEG
jgi:predicted amidohydrolase YtcJ